MSFVTALNSKDFVVTAHLNLAEVSGKTALERSGAVLQPSVDAIHLPDNTQMHISGVAAAAILLQLGIDPIVHLNCRDRNRIALHKDVTGISALGASSVLIMRGKKITDGKNQGARAVFDIPALDFMAYVQELKHDDESALLDNNFYLGALAELFDPDPEWIPKNLIRKCEAGVNFVQTQVCFDMDMTYKTRFMLALAPLPSAKVARWVQENVKGAIVPDTIVDRLAQAADPEQEGIEICAELMREMAAIPGVSGVNLHKFGELDAIPAAINAAGVSAA
jgi:5,10-methylenetetrahydrofolate reductase